MNIQMFTAIVCFVFTLGCLQAMLAGEGAKKLAVGDPAPLVEGKDQDGKTWKLSRFIGKKIVLLYFYPKDDTAGCTKQACGYRDMMSEFADANVEVVGVSFDTAESHRQFKAKHNLNFRLLADTDGKIADAYGTRAPGGVISRRVSFLIGLDGKIAHITDNPSADVHLKEVKNAIAKLVQKPKG